MIKTTAQTASSILTEAANTLSEEEWVKDRLFKVKIINGEKVACRCAHGQIIWCGEAKSFQDRVKKQASNTLTTVVPTGGIALSIEFFHSYMDLIHLGTLGPNGSSGIWKNGKFKSLDINDWIAYYKEQYRSSFNLPLAMAHYYAGLVGLTVQYNDDTRRTYSQVINKLKKAAALASSEGN